MTVADSAMGSKEVATTIAEGIILPEDMSNLGGMVDEEIISHALALNVSLRLFQLRFSFPFIALSL